MIIKRVHAKSAKLLRQEHKGCKNFYKGLLRRFAPRKDKVVVLCRRLLQHFVLRNNKKRNQNRH